jgi:hypothetical protein
MTAIKKRENLTKSEKQELHQFAGKCVFENVVFPPMQMGGQGTTIQDLIHSRSADSLGKYADHLETQGGKMTRTDKINSIQEKKISGSEVTYTDAVKMIDLIIKHKLYEEYREKVAAKRAELKEELERLETPKERKAKLKAELAELGQ